MNWWEVILITCGVGECWVEVRKNGVQVGADIDFRSRRAGLAFAQKECRRRGLNSFTEHRNHDVQMVTMAQAQAQMVINSRPVPLV